MIRKLGIRSPGENALVAGSRGDCLSAEGRVDLKRYGWDPAHDLTEEELHSILENAGNVHHEASPQLLGLMRNDPASPMRPS